VLVVREAGEVVVQVVGRQLVELDPVEVYGEGAQLRAQLSVGAAGALTGGRGGGRVACHGDLPPAFDERVGGCQSGVQLFAAPSVSADPPRGGELAGASPLPETCGGAGPLWLRSAPSAGGRGSDRLGQRAAQRRRAQHGLNGGELVQQLERVPPA